MAFKFGIKAVVSKAKRHLDAIRFQLSPKKQDPIARKVAWVVHRRMVQQTPKKWTGQTRRSWKVNHLGPGRYSVTNYSKVMFWLEHGTKAHGPRKAKALLIPLTRKAALAGARVVANSEGFTRGKDYIFVKRVRGIKALKLQEKYQPFYENALKAAMKLHVQRIIKGL